MNFRQIGDAVSRAIFVAHTRKVEIKNIDSARMIPSIVSLTVISGFIGVGASDLKDSLETKQIVFFFLFSTSMFYLFMEHLWEARKAKNHLRVVLALVCLFGIGKFLVVMFGQQLTGRSSIIEGTLMGWVISVLAISFLPDEEGPLEDEWFGKKE